MYAIPLHDSDSYFLIGLHDVLGSIQYPASPRAHTSSTARIYTDTP